MSKNEEEQGAEKQEAPAKKGSNTLVQLIVIIVVVLIVQIAIAFALIKVLAPGKQDAAAEGDSTATEASHGESGEHGEKGEKGEKKGTKKGGEEHGEKELVVQSDFEMIVNIAGTDGLRFLKVVARLAYPEPPVDPKAKKKEGGHGGAKKGEPANEFEAYVMHSQDALRSAMIESLSAIPLEEVMDKNAQQKVREELLNACNQVIPKEEGQLSNVYLKEFIVQ